MPQRISRKFFEVEIKYPFRFRLGSQSSSILVSGLTRQMAGVVSYDCIFLHIQFLDAREKGSSLTYYLHANILCTVIGAATFSHLIRLMLTLAMKYKGISN